MCQQKCAIQWIDESGNPTPDNNPAVGVATSTINGEAKSFPICENHLERMPTPAAYLESARRIQARTGTPIVNPNDGWTFKPFA